MKVSKPPSSDSPHLPAPRPNADKRQILTRRGHFVAKAMAGLGVAGGCFGCEPCLSVRPPTDAGVRPRSAPSPPVAADADIAVDPHVCLSVPNAENRVEGTGKLSVSARKSYCRDVFVNGRSAGPSPVAHLRVSAGSTVVICVTPTGESLARSLKIKPGQDARLFFRIEDDS